MIPTLLESTYVESLSYSGNVPTFPKHGIVDLVDCIECYAEQINDDDSNEWELSFVYPIGGNGFDNLVLDNIVLAKANNYQDPQAFRIYSVEKNIGKTVTVKAQHISYDMLNTPVKPFTAASASAAITSIRTNTIYGSANWKRHHFYFTTNISNNTQFKFDRPASMRSVLLNGEKSIKGTYGGDLIFNNYSVQLLQVGGSDRGIVLNYGVDLIDMTQEENNSEMVTGILPYYVKSESEAGYESNPIVYGSITYGPGTYDIQKIEPVDLTEFFVNYETTPTVAQINAKAVEWVAAEKIGIPEISLTVSYATLGQDVRMYDAIGVSFPEMRIDVKAKVSRYKYDVLLERCVEVDVGKAKPSKYFNLLDASKLKKGLIPPERITSNSITESKISSGAIGSRAIAPQAISGDYHIEPLSIDHDLLKEKAVTAEKIAAEAATTALINDEIIIKPNAYSGDYPDGAGPYMLNTVSISPKNLPKKAFRYTDTGTGGNKDDPKKYDLNPDIITDNTLPGDKVEDKGITTSKIDDSAVTSGKMASNSVITAKIKNAAVSFQKLSSGTQSEINKIAVLESDMAYVNKLFATTARIDHIRATDGYFSTVYVNNIRLGQTTFSNTTGIQDTDGNYHMVICS